MTGGRDSEDDEEPSDDSRSARLLMVAVLALAVASTAVLVLTDSAEWLRFGVLAALWAALLGVFLASRFRKAMAERENQVADLQSVYELELEREVAARREYELEVEAAARKRVEESNREDLAELRNELRHLRESLERLTGGEVLVERFALQAQSTRMRSLSDAQQRVVGGPEDSARMRRGIAAGPGQVIDGASTELIPRPHIAPGPTQVTPIAPVRREPQRRVSAAQQPTRVTRPVRQEPRPEPRQEPRQRPVQQPVQRVTRAQESQAQPAQPQSWPGQAAPAPAARPTQGQQRRPQQVARQGVRRVEPQQRARPEPIHAEPVRPEPARSEPARSEPIRPEPVRPEAVRPEPVRLEPVRSEPEPPPAARTGGHRRTPDQTQRAEPVVAERSSRHRQDQSRADLAPVPQPVAEVSPPVDEAPKDRQAYREWRQEPADAGDPETTGAHAAGKSVTELLAAHGQDDTPRRHRRRAE